MNIDSLPNYFNYFPAILPPEVIDVLITVEHAFALVNYDSHQDDITSIFNDYTDKTSKDLADITLAFYREHINSVLSLQGILLTNPYTDQLFPLATILKCVSVLATMPLSEILEGDSADVEETADDYFAVIISLMSELSVIQVLSHVMLVSPEIIAYLHEDTPLITLMSDTAINAAQRFKDCPLEKKGIIVEAIRSLGKFGYNVHTFLIAHAETIANSTKAIDDPYSEDIIRVIDPQDIANEIILLVLGSSTPDKLLLASMLEASEHIADNSVDLLKINTLILKFMEQRNG